MNKSLGSLGIIAALVLLVSLYGSAPLFLPKAQPASIPSDQFSAERAMEHVHALAQNPRVVGTTGMEQAAAYVVSALQACKLEPEIQESTSQKGILRNVIVRIPGTLPGNAILILTHVDSVSFGAGDNASGAAVLLEAACSIHAGKPLLNDVVLLFEDGEEAGYLGGYAYAAKESSVNTIRRVIGLDTAAWGPVVLLQTTPGNADFIRAYAKAVSHPIAFGFFADADWKISNDTSEIQPFYERSIPGLELEDPTSFTGKHSAEDAIEFIKPGSLQQMGDQVLALARSLGDSDLRLSSASDLSYFTLWGVGVIHYPANWNLFFAVLSFAGVVVLIFKKIRQKALKVHAVGWSTIILFFCMIAVALWGLLGSSLFSKLLPNPNPNTGSYLVPASLPYFLIVLATILIAYIFIRRKLVNHFGSLAVEMAGFLIWILLSIISAVLLPVGSYIFTIPLLVAVLVAFLPGSLNFVKIIPAMVTTILLIPNVVLAYLGTGMQTLVLVNILVFMNEELWSWRK